MKSRRLPLVLLVLVVVVGAIWLWSRQAADKPGTTSERPAAKGEPQPMDSRVAPGAPTVPNRDEMADKPAPAPAPGSSSPAIASAATPVVGSSGSISPDNALTGGTPSAAQSAASIKVAEVRRMIVDYHTLMGENPVGTNAEIMQSLMGGNARQATLGPPEGQALNSKGELIDEWGTPYFFHQLSKDRMEVRSAGPDKILGTVDDIVVR